MHFVNSNYNNILIFFILKICYYQEYGRIELLLNDLQSKGRNHLQHIPVILLKKIYCLYYATYNSKNAIIKANNPVASAKAKPKIA